MQKYLSCALEASELAQNIIITAYNNNQFNVVLKGDYTPVTEVDVAVERAIRAHISKEFPDHGFYGEEEGISNLDADFVWLIDPIDGTKAFIRGRPFFSCQIALMHKKEIILGVSCAPAFNGGERAYAVKGEGAYLNQKRINVSQITELKDAVFSSGNIKSMAASKTLWENYSQLIQGVNTTRGFGDFLHYHLLAAGKLDLVVESDVTILDVAALSIIVTEAGGCVTDFKGLPLNLDSKNIVASNGHLHDTALRFLTK